jgi:UDP-glucose 4-epimerase
MTEYKAVVTGGAGFIGSHLTERLLREGHEVTVVDNLSSGRIENIEPFSDNPLLTFVKEDLKKPVRIGSVVKESDAIFHFAANPEVRTGETEPRTHFEENVLATFNLLEAIRKAGAPKIIIFASTSTVYGEASRIPTPENYGPLIPISTYGASKLASEALIMGYAYTFNHMALILRLANIIGPRSTHGVIVDFIRKIRADPSRLEILGDGTQEKSYLHVKDCVDAVLRLTTKLSEDNKAVDVFNIGSKDAVSVREIAEVVAQTLGKSRITYDFTGGVDGGRGWKGDVKKMRLSIDKLLQTGWKPKYGSKRAVELAAQVLIKE